MSVYEIMRWDAIIEDESNFPYPVIYIKPDHDFEKQAKEAGNLFVVNISGTNMDYDNRDIVGMVHPSGYYPNFRPHFFNETGYWVIVLTTNWLGYPETLGKVKLQTRTVQQPLAESQPQPQSQDMKEKLTVVKKHHTSNKLDNKQLALTLGLIGVFLFSLLAIKLVR